MLLLYAAKQRGANPKTNAILSSLLRSIKNKNNLRSRQSSSSGNRQNTNKRDSRRQHRCLVQTHQCQLRTTIRTTFQGTQRTFENTQLFGTSKSRWRKLRCMYKKHMHSLIKDAFNQAKGPNLGRILFSFRRGPTSYRPHERHPHTQAYSRINTSLAGQPDEK